MDEKDLKTFVCHSEMKFNKVNSATRQSFLQTSTHVLYYIYIFVVNVLITKNTLFLISYNISFEFYFISIYFKSINRNYSKHVVFRPSLHYQNIIFS